MGNLIYHSNDTEAFRGRAKAVVTLVGTAQLVLSPQFGYSLRSASQLCRFCFFEMGYLLGGLNPELGGQSQSPILGAV